MIDKFSLEEKSKDNFNLYERINSIIDNCKELINIIKVETIEKYFKSFSKDVLIKENEYSTDEEKIDILDRFKDALSFVKEPKKRADKLLKAIYLANIVKIEYKMFNSNHYDILLKMIDECLKLKMQAPSYCEAPNLGWFNEICNIQLEIKEKKEKLKEDPKEFERKIKEEQKEIINEIEEKFKQGKFIFFFYILSEHKPIGITDEFIFNNPRELESFYN